MFYQQSLLINRVTDYGDGLWLLRDKIILDLLFNSNLICLDGWLFCKYINSLLKYMVKLFGGIHTYIDILNVT